MKIDVLGGSWITIQGWGTLAQALANPEPPHPAATPPEIPPFQELFTQPLARYGRFDNYTKLGCAAVALAIKEANLKQDYEYDKDIGLIISSRYGSYETDLNYYETAREEGGSFTSPNLFSYTLPGIIIGECAAYFKLRGPTFCTGEDHQTGSGAIALQAALNVLETGECDCVISGWLDYPPDQFFLKQTGLPPLYGAIFFVLGTGAKSGNPEKIFKSFESRNASVRSLNDLYALLRG